MRLQPVVLLTLLSCATPAAFAQSAAANDATNTSATPAHERQPLDTNHDGFITRDELQSRPGLAKHFDQIDTNHDGKIDRAEFKAFHDQMKGRREQKQQTAPAEASSD